MDWEKVTTQSKLSLTPRGFGRSAYKITETLQMGLVPVYVYDSIEWLPYRGTKADFSNFGYSFSVNNLTALAALVRTVPEEEIHAKRQNVLKFRESHFTTEGVVDQIKKWLAGGDSDLTCVAYPHCATDDTQVRAADISLSQCPNQKPAAELCLQS